MTAKVEKVQKEKESTPLKQRVLNLLNEGLIDKPTAIKLCPALERFFNKEENQKMQLRIEDYCVPVAHENYYLLDSVVRWKIKNKDGKQILVCVPHSEEKSESSEN